MKKILALGLVVILFFVAGCSSCGGDDGNYDYTQYEAVPSSNLEYSKIIVTSLKDSSRQSTVVADSGNTSVYDIPGNGVTETTSSKKTAILDENERIFNYDSMNSSGLLYLDGESTGSYLFKHRGADSQVATYLQDDTTVVKTMVLRNNVSPDTTGEELYTPVNLTGLYAPAGEVVKIEISSKLASTNPTVYIGATSSNGFTNDISSDDAYSRMPMRVKEMTLSSTVNYVGSPLGGQIYIQADMDEYEVTITGAVEYLHYVHNSSTRADIVRLYESTAPMIDIEIPNALRINMPRDEITQLENELYAELVGLYGLTDNEKANYRNQAKELAIDYIVSLADLLKLYTDLTTYICPSDLFRSNSITMFYDCYTVSDYSKVGSSFSTLPIASGRSLLNPTSDRFTALQLYNVHFWNNDAFVEQGNSSVTSNVLSILSYMLYDTYGEYRTFEENMHEFSDAGYTLNLLNKSYSSSVEIAKYVNLMHSFGAKTFIDAITTDVDTDIIKDRLYLQFSKTTQADMYYYFTEVLGWTITDSCVSEIKNLGYIMYIPVASTLQIGQIINGQKIYTAQSFGAFEDDIININDNIIVPTGASYTITSITADESKLQKVNDTYYYSTNQKSVDEFTVTLKVTSGSYSYTSTLIMGIAVQYSNTISTVSTTTIYDNVDNLSLDEVNSEDLRFVKSFTLSNSALMYSVNTSTGITGTNAIFVTYAEINFPLEQVYTLNARALGDVKISVGTSYGDLNQVVRYKNEGSISSYDITDSDRTFTWDASVNQKMLVKIELSTVYYTDSAERVEFYFGYLNGSSVSNIPDGWWYGQYSKPSLTTSAVMSAYVSASEVFLDNLSNEDLELEATYNIQANTGCNTSSKSLYGLFVITAEIFLPSATEYTFNMSILGDARVSVGADADSLKEVIRYKQEGALSGYDISDSNRTFTINGEYTQRIAIKIEMTTVLISDGNQRIGFALGYLNGDTVTNVPDSWWYSESSYRQTIGDYYQAYNTESLFVKTCSTSTFERVDQDLNIIYQTGKLDDKFLTTPNSSAQSIEAGSIVIYKYSKEVTANYFAVTSASEVDGVLSFLEIHVSDNGVDWTKAFSGINPYSAYNILELDGGFTFQYVKLVFGSQYSGSYIELCNFDFLLGCYDLVITDLPQSDLLYVDNVSIVENEYSLNKNILEFDGRIKFSFTGTSMIIYSNTGSQYGTIMVYVNDKVYEIDLSASTNYGEDILTLACLEYGTYEVIIVANSGVGNIDYIAVG